MNKATGVIKQLVTHIRDYDYETLCGSVGTEFPAEYEIPRENTGTLKDQGQVGACVAETIAQIAESFYKEEMSEGYIYGEFRNESMKKGRTGGLSPSLAMDFWRKLGTLPKKYFDILEEMPEMSEITARFPEFKEMSAKYKLGGYVTINYNKQKKDLAIKDALMKYNRGLVCVSDDYFPGGSHCIVLTGWNDENNTYKFKNSWGVNYGDKGFSEIPKNEVDICYLPLFEEVTMPFKDVTEDKWYYDDVKSVYMAGLMKGVSEDTFAPDKPITRAEMAAFGNRLLKEMDRDRDLINKVFNEKIKE